MDTSWRRSTWRRVILALASIPIAVIANGARIVGTGLCVQYWNPDKAVGFFHEFSGWLMFIVSLTCLYIVHNLMRLKIPTQQEEPMKSPRFWVVFLLLLAALTTLHLRESVDRVPPSEPLSPRAPIHRSTGPARISPSARTRSMYSGTAASSTASIRTPRPANKSPLPPVSLFIGYFPTQRTGQSIHSPQNCLPGAGWTFSSSKTIYLERPELKNYAVGEYLITNGNARQVVLYWYLAHGRSIANDYVAKAYMMLDAIRSNRTDGALIRLVTPLEPNESLATAQTRVINFADRFVPMLPRYIPN